MEKINCYMVIFKQTVDTYTQLFFPVFNILLQVSSAPIFAHSNTVAAQLKLAEIYFIHLE